eukprot:10893187-Alexandrium_andersonii.AAC.1
MSASLVGSEMCIRDRVASATASKASCTCNHSLSSARVRPRRSTYLRRVCLLYTSPSPRD